jgi:hypothetical protein
MIHRSRAGRPSVLYVCSIVVVAAVVTILFYSSLLAQGRSLRSPQARVPASNGCSSNSSGACAGVAQATERQWRDVDIGSPKKKGASAWNGNVIAVTGAGTGLGQTSDQGHFTYSRVIGDFDVIARMLVIDDEHPLASAGVMIRSSLSANAPYAALMVAKANGTRFVRRLVAGWSPIVPDGNSQFEGVWLKLQRRGARITGMISPDGITWTYLGDNEIDISADTYVGFAVDSHRASDWATGVFDSVSIRPVDGDGDAKDDAPAPDPDDAAGAAAPDVEQPVDTSEPSPAPSTPTADVPPVSEVSPPIVPPLPSPVPTDPVAPVTPARVPSVLPQYVTFEPSVDHETNVDSYLLEVLTPEEWPVVQLSIGKPAVVNGECVVDVRSLIDGLSAGTYVISVRAVNIYGMSPRAMSPALAK